MDFRYFRNKDRMALYNYRLKDRKELLKNAENTIQQARNMLYIMSALCFSAMFFFLSEGRRGVLSVIVLIIVAALFVGLGMWSAVKPFTSLLISFLVLITFIAINTWAEFMNLFTTFYGLYMLIVQALCFVFLFRGLQAAFRADIVADEFKT